MANVQELWNITQDRSPWGERVQAVKHPGGQPKYAGQFWLATYKNICDYPIQTIINKTDD